MENYWVAGTPWETVVDGVWFVYAWPTSISIAFQTQSCSMWYEDHMTKLKSQCPTLRRPPQWRRGPSRPKQALQQGLTFAYGGVGEWIP